MFHEIVFPFSKGTTIESTDLIPLPIIPSIPSPTFSDFPLSTTFSPSSSVSDDTIIQVHHDPDKETQDFPDALDASDALTESTTSVVPSHSPGASYLLNYVPHFARRSTGTSKPPSYLQAYHCNQVSLAHN